MQLLHLDSSMLGADSVSRRLSAEIVARQKTLHPGIKVISRDLAAEAPLHLSGPHIAALHGARVTDPALVADVARSDAYLQELLASDILVIGTPMYNLTIPTPLKSWIDRIALAGKTFRYTSTGSQGLLRNKKAFVASSRGGVYLNGSPAAALDHQETYLKQLLGFLGVTNVTVIRAEGVALGPDAKQAAFLNAQVEIAAIAD